MPDPIPPAGRDLAEWLVKATANLDAHIEDKATAIAAARIAAIEDKAEQDVTELMAGHAREVQRLEDLIKELRRQLKPLVRHIEQECPTTLERKARIKARMEQARQNR